MRKLDFFFSCPPIRVSPFTQNVLYIYCKGCLSNRQVFNNSFVGKTYSVFFLRSLMIRLLTLALIILHDRCFKTENLLWESSTMVLLGSTWILILLLTYDWMTDNFSDIHDFITANFRPSTFTRSGKKMWPRIINYINEPLFLAEVSWDKNFPQG